VSPTKGGKVKNPRERVGGRFMVEKRGMGERVSSEKERNRELNQLFENP